MPQSDAHPPTAWPPLLGTLATAFMPNGALSAARYVLPTLALSLGAGAFVTGILGAAFTAVAIVLCHPFGVWVDRVGARLPFICAMGLMAAGPVLYILMPRSWVLIATAVCVGTAAMFAHISSSRAIGDLGAGRLRTRNLGLLVLIYSLSQFIFPVIGGYSFEHFGTLAGLSVIALPPLLALALLRIAPNNYTATPRLSRPALSPAHGIRDLIRIARLRLWISSSSGFVAVQSIYPFLMALHANHIGLSPAQGGMALGYYALGTLTARASSPLILRVARPPRVIVTSMLLGACGYGVVPLTSDFLSLAVVSGLLGATLGIGVPLSLALVYDSAPDGAQNAAVGLNTAIGNGLQTILPLIFALSASVVGGVGPMIWVMSATMVVLAASIFRHKE